MSHIKFNLHLYNAIQDILYCSRISPCNVIRMWPINSYTHTNTHEKTVVNVSLCSSSPVEGPGTIVGDVAGEFGDEIPELVKRISACTKCSGYVSLFCYYHPVLLSTQKHVIKDAVWQMQIICLSIVDACGSTRIFLLHFLKSLC